MASMTVKLTWRYRVGPSEPPSSSQLEGLGFLNGVVQETMRVHASGMVTAEDTEDCFTNRCMTVGLNTRTALKDCSLPTGGGPNGTSLVGILAGTAVGKSSSVPGLLNTNTGVHI
jgi:hypothetical protein